MFQGLFRNWRRNEPVEVKRVLDLAVLITVAGDSTFLRRHSSHALEILDLLRALCSP